MCDCANPKNAVVVISLSGGADESCSSISYLFGTTFFELLWGGKSTVVTKLFAETTMLCFGSNVDLSVLL